MKLKGDYNAETTYDVGDVVRYANGEIYHLQHPCKAGVPPTETLYWERVQQLTAEAVKLIMDSMDLVGATVPKNINDESIVLKSGDNEYLISVDATGDTPELAVELIEEEGDS